FLVGTELKLDKVTLTITLGKSKGFMVVKEDVLKTICRDYYKKPITLVINEGQPKVVEKTGGSEKLVDEALEIFGGQVVEGR
ncbi:MAG: hypothetical protein IME98_00415, partial [Proteobacteria bacterium]|nr:hypothetical protein [Pseudomonadota bacterium]